VIGPRHPAPAANDEVPHEPAAPRWPWLLAGLALAGLGTFVLPCLFVWVLAAIPHEMGHATVGCLFGRPSAPAISLTGHAWAGIGDVRPALAWAIVLALLAGAFVQRAQLARAVPLALLGLALPFVGHGPLSQVVIAAAGHLGELAFAAYCYMLCWSGGRTGTPGERIAGAMVGGLLQARNLDLCWGLLHDPAARAHYETSGSLGMKNDYLVIAEDLCLCPLSSVVGLMLVPALLALPLGLWWGAVRQRRAALDD